VYKPPPHRAQAWGKTNPRAKTNIFVKTFIPYIRFAYAWRFDLVKKYFIKLHTEAQRRRDTEEKIQERKLRAFAPLCE
jgi:hypothetical protein